MGRSDEFEHLGLLYEDEGEYLAAAHDFIDEGLESGESVLVAMPGRKIARMQSALRTAGADVAFWNSNLLGRNPGRVIPAVREWIDRQSHSASRCRVIAETVWPGRRRTEIVEATRHEALINLAFAGCPATIMCAFDAGGLAAQTLDDVARTHPLLLSGGCRHASSAYADPLEVWRAAEWPLPDPPNHRAELRATRDLQSVRHFTDSHLRDLGLSAVRRQDLVLAVDEAATNAVRHGGGDADIRIWRDGSRVVCEVSDAGSFNEPLAGKTRPGLDWTSGRGVWLMNELCDLVELRPTFAGTVARMHLELDTRSDARAAPLGASARIPPASTEADPADGDDSFAQSAAA